MRNTCPSHEITIEQRFSVTSFYRSEREGVKIWDIDHILPATRPGEGERGEHPTAKRLF
jgi:hypothetical protein